MATFKSQGAMQGAMAGVQAGMAAGPYGALIGGVAGGLLGGIQSGGVDKARRKEEAYNYYLSKMQEEQGKAQQARLTAGFETNIHALGLLGAPDTYGDSYTSPSGSITGTPIGSGGSIFDTTSARAQVHDDPALAEKYRQERGYGLDPIREGVLDPVKFGEQLKGTSAFRIMSRQVAEAEGLTNPNSPFRQTLEASVKNPIIEQGAETLRESMRSIRNNYAKGGTARRTALKEANEMLAIERSNRQVGQQLWQANLSLETWIRDYQRETVFSAQKFVKGLGVNDYVNSMNATSQFIATTTIPAMRDFADKSFAMSGYAKKQALQKMMQGSAGQMGGFLGGAAQWGSEKSGFDPFDWNQNRQTIPSASGGGGDQPLGFTPGYGP
jgi:hypothetical protein